MSLTETLSETLFLPEPQKDSHSMLKCSGGTSKSHGCKESFNEVVIGRIEIDFFPKVDAMKQYRY